MKRFLILFIMCLTTIWSFAQGSSDRTLYVYRNDGAFNAFYYSEIDSMLCSTTDTVGVAHGDYVVQEIYTADSLYRIPLSAIDSISFITPKTEYRSNVKTINDSWIDYVVSVEELKIIIRNDIPTSLVPSVGDVLVAETRTPQFEKGFAGRVYGIDNSEGNITIYCNDVTLKDIYKTLVHKGRSESSTDTPQTKGKRYAENRNEMETMYFDIPHNLSLSLGPMSLNVSPTIMLDYIICINDNQTYIDNRITHHYDCSVQLDCELTGEYSPEPDLSLSFPIPTEIPSLYAEINIGTFFESSGGVIISMNQPFTITGTTGYIAYDDHAADIDEWHFEKKDVEFSANLNGQIRFGLAAQAKLAFVTDRWASMDVTGFFGPEISANLNLSSEGLSDGSLYTALKESVVTLSAYGAVKPRWRFAGFEHQELNNSPSFHFELNHWYILPEFNNLYWSPDQGGKGGKLNGGISRDLFWPGVQLGWALYDQNGQMFATQYYPETYRLMSEWPWEGLEMELNDLPYGCKYTAYPMIKVWGYEMRALPSTEVSIDPLVSTGNATDIEETSAITSGYVEGLEYSVVADAGICYSTTSDVISGNYISSGEKDGDFSIPLSGLNGNTTYFYCAYANCDGEYYYGEVRSFTTKEKEVPTPGDAIDLGLSVMWASRNVGANNPEDYGDYFAWGETSPKSEYTWDTYKYSESKWHKLTKYCTDSDYDYGTVDNKTVLDPSDDAATANWGSGWRMPTQQEMEELEKTCTWTWTTLNGVSGQLVTGPNGNSIFLPTAGSRWDTSLHYAGGGFYWSSSLYTGNTYTPHNAYTLCFFDTDGCYWRVYSREFGHSVRPVRASAQK